MGMIKLPLEAIRKFETYYPEIFASGNLAEGKWNKALAEFFVRYTEITHAVPFNSNGSGLLAILMLLRKHRGYKTVFVQSNTMYGVKTLSITSGLEFLGTVPCALTTLMPTAAEVSKFVSAIPSPQESVFVMSHIGGIVNPESEEIADICRKNGVAFVEDCAHSLGATLRGRHTGSFGVAGVYSLYATKAIAAGEGGIAVTTDGELAHLLEKFQIYDRFERVEDFGVNFRISELQALFALSMCELSEHIIANKAAIAMQYIEACEESGLLYVDPFRGGQRGNHYKFSLLARKNAATEFAEILHRTSPVYDYIVGPDPDSIATMHICLPIWYELDADVVSETVNQVLLAGRKQALVKDA